MIDRILDFLLPRHSSRTASRPRRRLLVDLSVLSQTDARTGIQRVVRAILAELEASPPKGFEVVPIAGGRYVRYRKLAESWASSTPKLLRLQPVSPEEGDIYLGLDYAAHIVTRRRRELRHWQRRGVRLVFVIYDLLPATHPEWFSRKGATNHARWLNFIMRRADGLVGISSRVTADVASAARKVRKASPPAIGLLRLGCDLAATLPSRGITPSQQHLLDLLEGRCFVLMVGTVEPRKAYDRVLAAFDMLWSDPSGNKQSAPPPSLVIAGRAGWKTETLQVTLRSHREHGDRLFWIADGSDELLDALYERTEGLLFASLGEGFGLPVAEAGRHGRRVLARDLPVLRESAPAWTRFFADDSPAELASAITSWLADDMLTDLGPSVAEMPTWSDSAQDLREFLARMA